MVDYIDGFSYVEPSLRPWDEAYLIMVDDFSDVSWIWFASILLSIFVSVFMRDIGMLFSFLVVSLCGLGINVIVAS